MGLFIKFTISDEKNPKKALGSIQLTKEGIDRLKNFLGLSTLESPRMDSFGRILWKGERKY